METDNQAQYRSEETPGREEGCRVEPVSNREQQ